MNEDDILKLIDIYIDTNYYKLIKNDLKLKFSVGNIKNIDCLVDDY